MRIVVATHGHCFDGLASAVVFTRLLGALDGPKNHYAYRACGYGDGQTAITEGMLSGEQNAILDYRFFKSPRVTWYFDHHQTAFATDQDRAFFTERIPTGRYVHDAACTSCTKLIANTARERFGVKLDDLAELIHWADVIDSAAFATPAEALDRSNPVMRLAAVIERHGDDRLLSELVPELMAHRLLAVASSERVDRRYEKIAAQHEHFVDVVRKRAQRQGRVVLVDLTDEPLESIGKFVTYALHPDAAYSVIIGALKTSAKISVGHNPWSGQPNDKDISAICARYGGGGHRFVGAVQFPKGEVAKARDVARAIASELDG
jgi:hypothetical protein